MSETKVGTFAHFRLETEKSRKYIFFKFGDGDGQNLCEVKKIVLVPHLLKIYFGLGWPSSVLEIVSVTKIIISVI